jgi:hypothetical protein
VPYFRSRVFAFIGSEDNLSFPESQVIIWDDMKRAKIGMLLFKERVMDLKLTKNAIFIILQKKILLFELLTLKYVMTFEDTECSTKTTSVNQSGNQIVLAHTSSSNKSIIKITKCIFN